MPTLLALPLQYSSELIVFQKTTDSIRRRAIVLFDRLHFLVDLLHGRRHPGPEFERCLIGKGSMGAPDEAFEGESSWTNSR